MTTEHNGVVVVRARPLWQRALAGITLAGMLAAVVAVFGAGRTTEATARDIKDHEQRLDAVEPRVDVNTRLLAPIQAQLDAIQRDAAETRKDVREIREAILARPPR